MGTATEIPGEIRSNSVKRENRGTNKESVQSFHHDPYKYELGPSHNHHSVEIKPTNPQEHAGVFDEYKSRVCCTCLRGHVRHARVREHELNIEIDQISFFFFPSLRGGTGGVPGGGRVHRCAGIVSSDTLVCFSNVSKT